MYDVHSSCFEGWRLVPKDPQDALFWPGMCPSKDNGFTTKDSYAGMRSLDSCVSCCYPRLVSSKTCQGLFLTWANMTFQLKWFVSLQLLVTVSNMFLFVTYIILLHISTGQWRHFFQGYGLLQKSKTLFINCATSTDRRGESLSVNPPVSFVVGKADFSSCFFFLHEKVCCQSVPQ